MSLPEMTQNPRLSTEWPRLPIGLENASFAVEDTGFMTRAASIAETAWIRAPWRVLELRLENLWDATRLKRLLDIVIAAALLVLLSPLLALALLATKLSSPGPVIFAQRRVGFRCREFRMYKLRTMVDGAEALEQELACQASERTFLKIENDPRVTPLGAFFRRYSIDELPQLYNVLRGDMSLVGPRPLLMSDLDKYPRGEQIRRFLKVPGLTGLWQVNGRSACSDDERIELDLAYADNWSLWLDLKILVSTLPVVLSAKGAY